MDKQIAQMAMQFLERVQLQGAEVPAYIKVMSALDDIVNREEVRQPTKSPA